MIGAELMKRLGGGSVGNVASIFQGASIKYPDQEAWKVDADGLTYKRDTVSNVWVYHRPWIDPQVGMSAFDIRATLLSGEIPAEGTLSTWQNLGTDRIWGWNDGVLHLSQLKMEIRLAATGSIIKAVTLKFVDFDFTTTP